MLVTPLDTSEVQSLQIKGQRQHQRFLTLLPSILINKDGGSIVRRIKAILSFPIDIGPLLSFVETSWMERFLRDQSCERALGCLAHKWKKCMKNTKLLRPINTTPVRIQCSVLRVQKEAPRQPRQSLCTVHCVILPSFSFSYITRRTHSTATRTIA